MTGRLVGESIATHHLTAESIVIRYRREAVTVVVTGVGAVTALGMTARATFGRILAGDRGFRDDVVWAVQADG